MSDETKCCDTECKNSCVVKQIEQEYDNFKLNAEKFYTNGNKSAGARARKALSELAKLAKVARKDIQDRKNAEKVAN